MHLVFVSGISAIQPKEPLRESAFYFNDGKFSSGQEKSRILMILTTPQNISDPNHNDLDFVFLFPTQIKNHSQAYALRCEIVCDCDSLINRSDYRLTAESERTGTGDPGGPGPPRASTWQQYSIKQLGGLTAKGKPRDYGRVPPCNYGRDHRRSDVTIAENT